MKNLKVFFRKKHLMLIFQLMFQLLMFQVVQSKSIKYLFHKQVNNLPFLFAPLNFKRLNSIVDENKVKILSVADKKIIELEKSLGGEKALLTRDPDGEVRFYDFTKLDKTESSKWHTISEWLGINNKYVMTWVKGIYDIGRSGEDVLTRYFETCLKESPSLPNYYLTRTPFIQKIDEYKFGNSYFDLPFWTHILIDNNAMETAINIFHNQAISKPSTVIAKQLYGYKSKLQIVLPVTTKILNVSLTLNVSSEENKNIKCFFRKNQYQPKLWNYVKRYSEQENQYLSLNSEPKQLFGIKRSECFFRVNGNTTSESLSFAVTKDFAPYLNLKSDKDNKITFSPYGIYNLMLLNFGLDIDGKELQKEKTIQDIDNKEIKLLDVSMKLNGLFNSNPSTTLNVSFENPWNKQIFKKENVLQLALVKIFEEEPGLFSMVKQAIDFDSQIKAFKTYKSFLNELATNRNFYGKNGIKFNVELAIDRIKEFLPNEKLTVAYFLTTILNLLWNTAIDKNYLYEKFALPVEKNYRRSSEFVKEASVKKFNNQSFLDIWKQIYLRLPQNNWISIDSYPAVFSFDTNLINSQIIHTMKKSSEALSTSELELMSQLGFTLISSSSRKTSSVFLQT